MTHSQDHFQLWAGTTEDAIRGTDINDIDWYRPGPFLIEAFHGTTHDFTVFDPRRGSHQGYLGQVSYFTSCAHDADLNYGHEGGRDLQNRIEAEQERLWDLIHENPEAFGMTHDSSMQEIGDKASALAREALVGSSPQVLEVFLRLDKPFVIDALNKKSFPLFDHEGSWGDAVAQLADRLGIPADEIEDNIDDHEDEIIEIEDEIMLARKEEFDDAVRRACETLGCEQPMRMKIDDHLFEDLSNREFDRIMRDDTALCDVYNDDGPVYHSLLSGIIGALGFDSIVLLNADKQFTGMEMLPATTHIHVLPGHEAKIKAQSNHGTFNPASKDIYA